MPRKPSTFEFSPASDMEQLGHDLVRFAVRCAILVHSDANLTGTASRLSQLSAGSYSAGVAEKRLRAGGDGDQRFIELVDRYLRDECSQETQLSVFSYEMSRFARALVGREQVTLDHTWFVPLTNQGAAVSKPSAIVRGWAACSWFDYHRQRGTLDDELGKTVEGEYPRALPATFRDRLDVCIDDLLTVTSMPAGQGHLGAAALAGRFGKYVVPHIRRHVEYSPVGWRTIRAATQALLWARNDSKGREATEEAVYSLLKEIDDGNFANSYRARSFWEECIDAMPRPLHDVSYNAERDRDLTNRLVARATKVDLIEGRRTASAAPVRERQTAAAIALSRIMDREAKFPGFGEDIANRLVDPLRTAALPAKKSGKTPERTFEAGLDYAAEYVEHRSKGGSLDFFAGHTADFWSRHEVTAVTAALGDTDARRILEAVPEAYRKGAEQLVAASVLAVNGVLRRRLVETLVAAGLGNAAMNLFAHLAQELHGRPRQPKQDTRFIVENAVFLLGLTGSVEAIDKLKEFAFPVRRGEYGRATRMTALMGIGDLAHLIRSGIEFEALREQIIGLILRHGYSTARAGSRDEPFSLPELRAALHVLTMLRPDDARVETFLKSIVDGEVPFFDADGKLTRDRDAVSVWFAEWCLRRIKQRRDALNAKEISSIPSWLVSPLAPHTPPVSTFRIGRG